MEEVVEDLVVDRAENAQPVALIAIGFIVFEQIMPLMAPV